MTPAQKTKTKIGNVEAYVPQWYTCGPNKYKVKIIHERLELSCEENCPLAIPLEPTRNGQWPSS